ncbi:uncharacterized protein M6B38_106130 [Iris pallida]|uniref:Uncharacterized protein n=1 Tax=Iris pallida TaxID=29817 RepID=A0AAX6ERT2_IRIPA|nr:uncharacterized protein M6B38_106130 [Iris pallida]
MKVELVRKRKLETRTFCQRSLSNASLCALNSSLGLVHRRRRNRLANRT